MLFRLKMERWNRGGIEMEIIQTITFTEDERDVIAGAFEVMDEIADGIKGLSVRDVCEYFIENIEYDNGSYVCPIYIDIKDLR